MRVCGCEISAQEVRLAVVQLNDEQNLELLRIKTTRIELKDDTSEADLRFKIIFGGSSRILPRKHNRYICDKNSCQKR